MIKVGMNLMLWNDTVTLAKDKALFDKVMGMGFDGLEIAVHAGMTMDEATEIGAYCKEKGYPVVALGVMPEAEGNTVSPDPKQREAGVEVVCRHIELAHALGSDELIGPYTQGLGYFSGDRPTAQEWEWSIEGAKKICKYAQKFGVKIGFEPLNRFEQYMLNTLEKGAEYIKAVDEPNAGLLLDTMHQNIEEDNVAEAFRKAMPYALHIHISENHRGVPGEGHACGADVFEAIKEGFNGWISIEAFNEGAPSLQGPLHLWMAHCDDDDELARRGLAYIRKMLK